MGMARKRGTKNTGCWRAMVGGAGVNDVGVGVVDETGGGNGAGGPCQGG